MSLCIWETHTTNAQKNDAIILWLEDNFELWPISARASKFWTS